jgi:hypothetical protein
MRRFFLAIRVFFRTLLSGTVAEQVDRLLGGEVATCRTVADGLMKPQPPPRQAPSARSDAITLLASLQREARFVDFVKESLADYSDAQIGAVARDVQRGCADVLERLFAVRPLLADKENDPVDVPRGFDTGRYQLTGNVTGEPPFHGRLVHHGWQATICDLAVWSGSDGASRVVGPAEVELK